MYNHKHICQQYARWVLQTNRVNRVIPCVKHMRDASTVLPIALLDEGCAHPDSIGNTTTIYSQSNVNSWNTSVHLHVVSEIPTIRPALLDPHLHRVEAVFAHGTQHIASLIMLTH